MSDQTVNILKVILNQEEVKKELITTINKHVDIPILSEDLEEQLITSIYNLILNYLDKSTIDSD